MNPDEIRQIIRSAENQKQFNNFTNEYHNYSMDPIVKLCILKILGMIEDIYRRLG